MFKAFLATANLGKVFSGAFRSFGLNNRGEAREIIELHRRANWVLSRSGFDAWMNLILTMARLKSLFLIAVEGVPPSDLPAAALGALNPT